jgi:hypothetical protein
MPEEAAGEPDQPAGKSGILLRAPITDETPDDPADFVVADAGFQDFRIEKDRTAEKQLHHVGVEIALLENEDVDLLVDPEGLLDLLGQLLDSGIVHIRDEDRISGKIGEEHFAADPDEQQEPWQEQGHAAERDEEDQQRREKDGAEQGEREARVLTGMDARSNLFTCQNIHDVLPRFFY